MSATASVEHLEAQLNDPDLRTRLHALRELKHLAGSGKAPVEAPKPWVNMHVHTFFSYNAHGFSPCRGAWEMYKRGVSVAGMIDFDVLDGMEEGLAASDALLYPFTVGIETRVYVTEFERDVLSSPNEPGIAYYCGAGFTHMPEHGSEAEETLKNMGARAQERNRAMADRVNAYLGDVAIDYDTDVVPLGAAGKPTERHMLAAYEAAAEKVFPDAARRAHFWAARLRMKEDEVARLLKDSVQFRNTMRKQLMKFGSPGYAAPDPKNFPTLEQAVSMIRACGALPMYAWLDGTNPGEADTELLVDYFISAGGAALNIVPERNWNLKDPAEKAQKVAKLNEVIEVAKRRNLPINAGTELNSSSQPMVDHFDAPELRDHRQTLLDGAHIIWGHSLLLRHGGFGYLSEKADAIFANNIQRKNEFYLQVGRLPVPHGAQLADLRKASRRADPKAVLKVLQEV